VGENSPKIQGGPEYDQVWNLSPLVDSASRDNKIAPLNFLGAEKLWVKILNLNLIILPKGGPHRYFYIFQNLLGSTIKAETCAFLALEITR